jgi:hypothetical protein
MTSTVEPVDKTVYRCAQRDALHRLGSAARPSAPATLELIDVVARLSFVGPLLDLLFAHDLKIE